MSYPSPLAATGLAQSYADEHAYDLSQTYNLAQPDAELPLELGSELSVDKDKPGKAAPAENPLDKEMADIKKQIAEC